MASSSMSKTMAEAESARPKSDWAQELAPTATGAMLVVEVAAELEDDVFMAPVDTKGTEDRIWLRALSDPLLLMLLPAPTTPPM